jgi:phage shock protein A
MDKESIFSHPRSDREEPLPLRSFGFYRLFQRVVNFMGLLDRIGRLMRANVNDMVSKAEDPEKILEQAVLDMQEDLVQLRQAVASAIANQKRTEQQYNKAMADSNSWQSKAQLALQKGDENLAREALVRKKSYSETADSLKAQLDGQAGQIEGLKRSVIQLESKIAEAKTKKDMLKARSQAAKAQEQLQGAVGRIGNKSAMAAFERMEEKVLQAEARSQAEAELAGSDLENKFAQLEAGNDVDDELEMMKRQLSGASPTQQALPQGTVTPTSAPQQTPAAQTPVDRDLEDLRKQIDNL